MIAFTVITHIINHIHTNFTLGASLAILFSSPPPHVASSQLSSETFKIEAKDHDTDYVFGSEVSSCYHREESLPCQFFLGRASAVSSARHGRTVRRAGSIARTSIDKPPALLRSGKYREAQWRVSGEPDIRPASSEDGRRFCGEAE